MFKVSAIVLLVAVACSAIPLENEEYEVAESHGDRHARATCDLLSFSAVGVSVGHSACATHCLVLGRGYRGGRCIDGVCNCRK